MRVPFGSGDVVVIVNSGMMVRGSVGVIAVCAGTPESVTLKVNGVAVAEAVGVPLMTPAALRVKPAGSVPEFNCQVSVPMPPVAARGCEYDVLTTPLGSDVVVVVNSETMVRVRVGVVAVCAGEPESVTLKVNGTALAVAVGVPLIRPAALRVKPAGIVPEFNCQVSVPAPPLAAKG